ncbi:uncharacterized protein OCT59_003533 [Rhizophagus irregularis]|uniref:Uncharacterized protein n=1 Tax=Rhizophagus irregularis (strain DAOM 197198w) TaxID=1432141 RepID=A0A015MUT1_RHIIW|nr:hypothetical protein RirG_086460 [Rhizophagus irregularis DAOM 197198w]UZO11982.1 hypothetical protein OCT59_003533 [Rhizophagus irregularis]GBC37517.1 hypothetical protein RIR_jg29740.t1 [Rhizophagus irregularis DAOM 181602=DAOM 197198]CAB4383676.1 unnamed protein product [Rhizophagus irregularis]CAB5353256.1 unnamed protein product [Rhizophagus irregularis]
MTKCTNDLKTEFRIQTIKLYLCPENDDWDYKYDAVSKAKRYLKAERHLTRAQEILLGSSTCKTNQPLIVPDTAEALETVVDIQLVQKLQTKVISLHMTELSKNS